MSLVGKTFVITGGGSGIGAETARYFASKGANVAISGRRLDALKAVADGKPNVLVVQGDAAVEADLERLRDETVRAFGAIHGVFLNAGYEGCGKPLAETSAAELTAVYVVNNVGPILGIKYFTDELAKTKGAFVITSSGGSVMSPVGVPVDSIATYISSKSAADSIVRAFDSSLAAKHVRILSVNPASYASEMTDKFIKSKTAGSLGLKTPSDFAFVSNPLGNLGNPFDIAVFVEAVFTNVSKYDSGHSVLVFPSTTDGKPLTVDAQAFYSHISERFSFSHWFPQIAWSDVNGVPLDDESLAEVRKGIIAHGELIKSMLEKQAKK